MTETDLIIIGAGAAGMTAAITARKNGLDVVLVEKTPHFGGTTAFSGGAPWVPFNHVMKQAGFSDTREAAETYLRDVLGDLHDDAIVKAFLDNAAEMVQFMERHSEVHFKPSYMPDYEPERPGTGMCRTLLTQEYDGRKLGEHLKTLRPQMQQLMLFGSMQLEGSDIHPLRKVFKTWAGFTHTTRLMKRFIADRLVHGRGMRLANGNALAARLLRSCLDAGVTMWNNTPAVELIQEAGAVRGVVVKHDGQTVRLKARRGVLLASGGFGANAKMRGRFVPMNEHHYSLQPDENVGDGVNLGVTAGGVINETNPANCIWAPVSVLKRPDGTLVKYPHIFIDRNMPGCIAVDTAGRRFVNEARSYQNFIGTMHRLKLTKAYLLADRAFLRTYGLGLARPAPFSEKPYLDAGYLVEGATLADLAGKIGADPATLAQTVQRFNDNAVKGVDPDFGRGGDVYTRFRGDPTHQPNPTLGPIGDGPYYALTLHPGDLSTVVGLNANANAQVLDAQGRVIEGLYCAGLDMNSMMRGMYPGGGSSIGPAMTFGYIAARHMAGVAEQVPVSQAAGAWDASTFIPRTKELTA
ncbi:MAG: FAD-dependent oxidoreductase [Burkholderiales bacterium]